jgi:CRISPR-associated protein Cas5d
VLKPIRHFSILRNEVNSKEVVSTAQSWAKDGGGYFAEEDRAQRHTLALRDVAYLIKADIELKPHATDDSAKYRDQFRRRASRGQCHSVPYFGCREFAAHFSVPDGDEKAIDLTDDLGRMLFDLDYAADSSGRGTPRFFVARLEQGVLKIPEELYRKER